MKHTLLALVAASACLFGATLPTLAPAQPAAAGAPAPCNGVAVKFICGVRNPEDLVQVPGTNWIIGSGMSVTNQAGSGGLILIDDAQHTAVRLPAPFGHARKPFTGCSSPPDVVTFSAHGLNIRPAGRGKSTLYVVGHGAREAIEVFDVVTTKGAPSVTWAGCVMAMSACLVATALYEAAEPSVAVSLKLMPSSFAYPISLATEKYGQATPFGNERTMLTSLSAARRPPVQTSSVEAAMMASADPRILNRIVSPFFD